MNGAHLASPIRGELGYAHRPQLGSQIHCPIGNQICGPLGKDDVCPNFSLTVGKFVFSNSGNLFRAKANPPKPLSPGLALNAHSGNDCGPIPVLTGMYVLVSCELLDLHATSPFISFVICYMLKKLLYDRKGADIAPCPPP